MLCPRHVNDVGLPNVHGREALHCHYGSCGLPWLEEGGNPPSFYSFAGFHSLYRFQQAQPYNCQPTNTRFTHFLVSRSTISFVPWRSFEMGAMGNPMVVSSSSSSSSGSFGFTLTTRVKFQTFNGNSFSHYWSHVATTWRTHMPRVPTRRVLLDRPNHRSFPMVVTLGIRATPNQTHINFHELSECPEFQQGDSCWMDQTRDCVPLLLP